MDVLTFIATIVGHLAWPTVLVVGVVFVSRRAGQLSRFIKKVRYGDFEIEIREQLDAARGTVEQIEAISAPTALAPIQPDDRLLELARIDPGIAMVDVWRSLEDEIIKLMQHNGLMRFTNPVRFVRKLAALGKISPEQLKLFERLRSIRNSAVHSSWNAPEIALGEVLEFRELVGVLTRRFQEIALEPNYIAPD